MTQSQPVDDFARRSERRPATSRPGLDRFVVVPLDGSAEWVPVQRVLLQKIADPSWLVSLLVHVALLLILAWCIFPSNRKTPMVMLGETIPDAEVQELEFEPLQIQDFELQLDPELEVANVDEMEALEDLQLEPDFRQPAELQDDLSGELIEHQATRQIASSAESVDPGLSSDQRLAAGIQDQVVKAGGKNGEVQFSLVWKTITDLDLHVVTPSGERVCYLNRRSRCQGELDVDRNARETTTTPVENIRWLEGRPESGRYTVIVHMYRLRGRPGSVQYDLMAKTGDDIDLQENQRIMLSNRLQVFRYIYFSPSIPESQRVEGRARLQRLQEKEEFEASTELALVKPGNPRETQLLSNIVRRYPHTDAAIEALKRMSGRATK
jgi:hypothetical protein